MAIIAAMTARSATAAVPYRTTAARGKAESLCFMGILLFVVLDDEERVVLACQVGDVGECLAEPFEVEVL